MGQTKVSAAKMEGDDVTRQDQSVCCAAARGRLQIVADFTKSPPILRALQRELVNINENTSKNTSAGIEGRASLRRTN